MILTEDMATLVGQDSQGYGVFISTEGFKAWRACFDGEDWYALPGEDLWLDEEGDFPTTVVGRLMRGTRQFDYVHTVEM